MANNIKSWLNRIVSQYKRLIILLCAFVFVFQSPQGMSDTKQALKPIVIEIAYIYNFMKFVEWPADAMPEVGEPYTLCTAINNIDHDVFAPLSKKKVKDNPITVDFKVFSDDFSQCNLVFISELNKTQTKQLLVNLEGLPILTIGTDKRFLDYGGMIEFHISLGQVTFSVDLNAVSNSNLSISANMLDVAEKVRR